MTYRAPVGDIAATMKSVVGLEQAIAGGLYGDLSMDVVDAVLEEAGKFASDRIAPLNKVGDKHGTPFKDGVVTMPPGWKEVYTDWAAAGWNGLMAEADYGGQALPCLINAACLEMWNAASGAFGLGPLLTQGAIEAISAHAAPELRAKYLPKMVSGEWTGTMNLTEPSAGSDLAGMRTKAERAGDGTYRITGSKIYITYGEHDLTDNIIHLVLARLPDAPAGTKGISLFIVPKFLVGDDGSIGGRNDVRCNSIEHKLGVHGSPTCTMVYGDAGGAIGWLVGEENRGLAAMFTMMNNARLAVALQGVSIAERATQQAFAYASDRRQGRAPGYTGEGMGPIILHPDVKRMLMTMRTYTSAARAICYMTASEIDRAHLGRTEAEKKAGNLRASLLTPIAKAFSTDIGNEVASLGVQVHGGMGFVEETGAAQHMRDARIYAIYEGTNGIQAIDLVTRKLPLEGGEVAKAEITRMRAVAAEVAKVNAPGFGRTSERLVAAIDSLERATDHLLAALKSNPADALAGATPYGRLFGLALGGTALAEKGLAVLGDDPHQHVAAARFFAENLVPAASGLELAVTGGGDGINEINVQLAG
ncbi:acyl-CoA dehydrogenase [Phreatobacter aquaticus]|uniref:3-methylmercaptopropionyl-CoA dehydrogenase n=1 Tax=Phreatobacter aquaticus TaxID=2570229 RepID=A0A4D7QM29_9HYPH|nr:acyl-CoA dehydrogenase [Phreatobacter aquaticus]QCK86384.1 acyl-CoA dehydrogenase [Phreatobacter aquaticus]